MHTFSKVINANANSLVQALKIVEYESDDNNLQEAFMNEMQDLFLLDNYKELNV